MAASRRSLSDLQVLVLATLAVGGFARFVQRAVGRGGPEAAQTVARALRTASALGVSLACRVLVWLARPRWQVVAFIASVAISAVFIGRFGPMAGPSPA